MGEENKPLFRVRSGQINVNVWENETLDKNTNQARKWRSFTLQKRYKDGEEWKTSSSYTVNDITHIRSCLEAMLQRLTVTVEG